MVSAQTYVNKGRVLQQLGKTDSVTLYTDKAEEFCKALPYNSGMVDVDLLQGIHFTEKGGDWFHLGIQKLQQVVMQGTPTNRAKAYHQLAHAYLKSGQDGMAEIMLDSLYSFLKDCDSPTYIKLDYKPILEFYQKNKNQHKVEIFTGMMLKEQQALKAKRLNFNLVEAIADLQTEQQRQEFEIVKLEKTNQFLWFSICIVLSLLIVSMMIAYHIYQKKQHKIQMRRADDKLHSLLEQLNQATVEKEMISQEFDEIMNDKDYRQELETLTPSLLQKNGESKFRQRFELLYPLFLPRLRERVPSITRREELLSMLIVLKQDNKEIADLLAIAPRSVLMLRHRFRQKIGMTTENSLENFIETMLASQSGSKNTEENAE